MTEAVAAGVERYLALAERSNTQASYAAAVRHFEVDWRGVLPASPRAVAEYLANYAPTLAVSTLQARLAGLARWHVDHGFVDPSKSQLVRRVLRGIRTAHNLPPRQARPIELDLLERVSVVLESALARCTGDTQAERTARLRLARDQAMLLLGFWRGFRADELTRLRVEDIAIEPGVGMTCYLPSSKADRQSAGQRFRCPALTKLCPVSAVQRWQELSDLVDGPLFRRIDRWGRISPQALAPKAIVPWLRELFAAAGISEAADYSSHSLRRGFANWARDGGWDMKELMEYVGWRDVNSALRYLDDSPDTLASRFEHGLHSTGKTSQRGQLSAASRLSAERLPPKPATGAKVVHLPVRRVAK